MAIFRYKNISTTELRDTSSCLDALEKDPHLVFVVKRRGRISAHLVSAEFFNIQRSVDDGELVRFEVPVDGHVFPKEVTAERISAPDELHQSFLVNVDGMVYEFKGPRSC